MNQFDLLKSHIEAFTRKDGSVVAAHDDKRVAAKVVKTKNEADGYHGEVIRSATQAILGGGEAKRRLTPDEHKSVADKAAGDYSAAANHLVDKGHFSNHDEAREFLDSKHGRHLHDDFQSKNPDSSGWVAHMSKVFNATKKSAANMLASKK